MRHHHRRDLAHNVVVARYRMPAARRVVQSSTRKQHNCSLAWRLRPRALVCRLSRGVSGDREHLQTAIDRDVSGGVWVPLSAACRKTVSTYVSRMQLPVGQWAFGPPGARAAMDADDASAALNQLAHTTIAFVGDSFLRELFESMLELVTGAFAHRERLRFANGTASSIPPTVQNAELRRRQGCGPWLGGLPSEKNGFDIACHGWPQLAIWRGGLNVTFLFSFHGNYETSPAFEQLTYDRLTNGTLQPERLFDNATLPHVPPADLLITGEGVWGAMVRRKDPNRKAETMRQLVAMFNRTQRFRGPIVWVTGDPREGLCSGAASSKTRHYQEPPPEWLPWLRNATSADGSRTVVIERAPLAWSSRELKIPGEHGYRGDVAYALSKLLLEIITDRMVPCTSEPTSEPTQGGVS